MKAKKLLALLTIFAMLLSASAVLNASVEIPAGATQVYSQTFAEAPNWRYEHAIEWGVAGPDGALNAASPESHNNVRGIGHGFGDRINLPANRPAGPELSADVVAFQFDVLFNEVMQNRTSVTFAVAPLDERRHSENPPNDWFDDSREGSIGAGSGSEFLDIIFRIYRYYDDTLRWVTGVHGENPAWNGDLAEGHTLGYGVINIPPAARDGWLRATVVFDFAASTVSFQLADSVTGAVAYSRAGIAIDPVYEKVEVFGAFAHQNGNEQPRPIAIANFAVYTAAAGAAVTPDPVTPPAVVDPVTPPTGGEVVPPVTLPGTIIPPTYDNSSVTLLVALAGLFVLASVALLVVKKKHIFN